MKFGIGAPVRRKEDAALITGRGRYVADIRPDNTSWAQMLRSPVAHGVFNFTDLETARSLPGVLAVLTAEDVQNLGAVPCLGLNLTDQSGWDQAPQAPAYRPLAEGTVRYVGEPIAMIVAENPAAARDAADAIGIEFEERLALADMDAALGTDAPEIHPGCPGNIAFDWQAGQRDQTDEAFLKASRVVSVDLTNNRVVTNYMETRAATGEYDSATGRYTLTSGSQGAHVLQAILAAHVLRIPREKLRVITPDVGGGFGTKLMLCGEYALVLAAAERVGRPVTWVAERTEHFIGDYQGRAHRSHAELALDERGRFMALRVDTFAEMGAYFSQMGPFIPTNGSLLVPGIYRIPAVSVRVRGVFTNTVPVDAYRGAGRPEAAYLIERLVDKAARETGLPPDVIRRRNFIPPSKMPFKTPTGRVYDSGEFDGHMRRAMEAADWAGFKKRLREAGKNGKLRGIGLATYIEACSGGSAERAVVNLESDGSITVRIGSQSTGQGHVTAYAQLVAERLGLPIDRIRVIQGDTDEVATGSGSGGSRSIPVGGASVSQASEKLGKRIRDAAADMLEAAPADLQLEQGLVRIAGTDRSISFAEIGARAAETGQPLSDTEAWAPSVPTYPNGSHVVEVEVDGATGAIEIIRYTVVDDFGVTLNPLMLEGQVHGGIAQGIGQALMERTVYDPDSGQLLTATFQDYAIPRAGDLPMISFETRNVPSTTNALGMKGAGEAGSIGACPAVVNAVVDALHRAAGITHIDMPITSEAVWRALNGAPASGSAQPHFE